MVFLRPEAKRLVLQTLDEIIIDAHFLKENEVICPGSRVDFAAHRVFVGDHVPQDYQVEDCSSVDLPLSLISNGALSLLSC